MSSSEHSSIAAPDTNAPTAPPAICLIALTLAATSIGFAIHQHGGEYTPAAMAMVSFAIFGTAVSFFTFRGFCNSPQRRRIIFVPVCLLIALSFASLLLLWPVGREQSASYRLMLAVNPIVLISLAGFSMWRRRDSSLPRGQWWLQFTMAAVLIVQFFALFTLWPVGADHPREIALLAANRWIYLYLIASAGFLLLLGFLDLASTRRWWFPGLLIVHSMLAFWTIRSCPVPHIDVWYFQQMAPQKLLAGQNPYDAAQVQFPDIYNSTLPGHQRVYGQGMVRDGVLQFGFPYPPISLFCSTAPVRLGKDPRYAQALALTLAGLFIGFCRPGRMPKLAAALFLFTPTVWFVIGRAWTEPIVIMFLAATIFCAARRFRWLLPVAFGLFLASKQYLVFAVPLSFLLVEGFDFRFRQSWLRWIGLLVGAGLVAAAVTLPLALWNFHAFWFSTVTVQQDAPFRWDALSYLVWAGLNLDTRYTTWVWLAFAGAGVAMLLALGKARRSPAGFAGAMALTYLLFIAFNKQAFCNYYFFVIALICCTIAASGSESDKAVKRFAD